MTTNEVRGKTTAASTPGSFAPHTRSDAETSLDSASVPATATVLDSFHQAASASWDARRRAAQLLPYAVREVVAPHPRITQVNFRFLINGSEEWVSFDDIEFDDGSTLGADDVERAMPEVHAKLSAAIASIDPKDIDDDADAGAELGYADNYSISTHGDFAPPSPEKAPEELAAEAVQAYRARFGDDDVRKFASSIPLGDVHDLIAEVIRSRR